MKMLKSIFVGLMILCSLGVTHAQSQSELTPDKQRKFDFFFLEALRSKALGDYARSVKFYDECLKIDPKSAVCRYEVATMLNGDGDKKEIIHSLLRTATQLSPDNRWYAERLAQFYVKNNSDDKAIEIYKQLAIKNPEQLSYKFSLVDLYKRSERFPEAIATLAEMQKTIGTSPELIMQKQQMQIQIKDYDGALEDIDELIAKFPNDYKYQLIKGDIYMESKSYKNAYKVYNAAMKQFPDNGDIHLSLAGYYDETGDEKKTQAEVLEAFKSDDVSVDRKLSILAQYLQSESYNQDSTLGSSFKHPVNTDALIEAVMIANPNNPTIYRFAGIKALDKQDTTKAVALFRELIRLDSMDKEIWGQLLYLKVQQEKWSEVKMLAKEASSNNPLYPQFFLFEGIAEYQMEELEEAANSYEQGISYCIQSDVQIKVQLLSSLGDTYYKLGRKEDTYKSYEEVLSLDENNLMVMNNYAYFLSEDGVRLEDAERMSRKTIDLDPLNATYLDTYAWVLYKRGKYDQALQYMETMMQFQTEESNSSEVIEHYGDILYALGRKEEAKQKWMKAIELGGNKDELYKKIENEK